MKKLNWKHLMDTIRIIAMALAGYIIIQNYGFYEMETAIIWAAATIGLAAIIIVDNILSYLKNRDNK